MVVEVEREGGQRLEIYSRVYLPPPASTCLHPSRSFFAQLLSLSEPQQQQLLLRVCTLTLRRKSIVLNSAMSRMRSPQKISVNAHSGHHARGGAVNAPAATTAGVLVEDTQASIPPKRR